jgi:hypothetical protein
MRSQRSDSVRARSVRTASCVWEGAGKGSGGDAAGANEGPAAGAETNVAAGDDIGARNPGGNGMAMEGK